MATKPTIKKTSRRVNGAGTPLRTISVRVPPALWDEIRLEAIMTHTTAQEITVAALRSRKRPA